MNRRLAACLVLLGGCHAEAPPPRCPETPAEVVEAGPAAANIEATVTVQDYGLSRLPEAPDAASAHVGLAAFDLAALRASSSRWFEESIADAQVLLIGEGHWSVESDRIGVAIVLAAAEHGFAVLSFEVPYSSGRELDRYVHLQDTEARAAVEQLAPFTTSVEQLEFLETIRAHNRDNPTAAISIHAHDVEHDWNAALERVVLPYLAANGLEASAPGDDVLAWAGEVDAALSRLRPRSQRARTQLRHAVSVLDNVQAKIASSGGDGAFFHYFRQQAIVANLVESERDGPLARGEKTIVWGGAHHMQKDLMLPGEGAFLVEGAYLQQRFAATRGRVASVRLETLGYGFDHVAEVDVSACPPTGRRQLIRQFQGALQAGTIRREEFVAVDALDPVQLAVLHSLDAAGRNIDLLERVDWEALGSADALAPSRHWIDGFDHTVYVARSSLSTPGCAVRR